jgi:hypothetical protein
MRVLLNLVGYREGRYDAKAEQKKSYPKAGKAARPKKRAKLSTDSDRTIPDPVSLVVMAGQFGNFRLPKVGV